MRYTAFNAASSPGLIRRVNADEDIRTVQVSTGVFQLLADTGDFAVVTQRLVTANSQFSLGHQA
jgi:hypothetical protein